MFNIFTALTRLTNAINAFANTLEDANGRMQECIGQRQAPVDVTPEPLPAPDEVSGNGEHKRKKEKVK